MELLVLISQLIEVKILEKMACESPSFLGRKESILKRNVPCQVWAQLVSHDLIKEAEELIKNINGKEFYDCFQIYDALKKSIRTSGDGTFDENKIAVRLQDGNKWSQIGDFEPK